MNIKAIQKICCGMYVAVLKEDKINGQIANTLFQITSEPPTVAVSINRKARTSPTNTLWPARPSLRPIISKMRP